MAKPKTDLLPAIPQTLFLLQSRSAPKSVAAYGSPTNAFSKKLSHLKAACALHFAHYYFCRIHQTLRVTPAMEAGVAGHVWDVKDLVALLPAIESKPRGSFKKRE
jgi:hypothetical protein